MVPTDQIDDVKNEARMDVNKVLTGERFLPVALLIKGGEEANLLDLSLTGTRVRHHCSS